MFKVNNKERHPVKTVERRREWHRSSVFIVNFEHISHC